MNKPESDPLNPAAEVTITTIKVSRAPFINNSYMVLDPRTGKALLIDPAWEMAAYERALEAASAELAGILITHAHPDHTDLAAPLAERYRCPVWISHQEAESSGFRVPTMRTFGECAWEVGGIPIRPIITPGHTPGSTCYWIGQALFTGDTLFIEGCGLCPDRAAAESMYSSLERLKTLLPGGVRIYPGHSYVQPPGLTFEKVFDFNLYLSFSSAEVFANFRLRPGQSKAGWMAFS